MNTTDITDLHELLAAIQALTPEEADDDLADLPTFGGSMPADCAGVYSWDETHILVGPGAAIDPHRAWAIVSRDTAE